jgi:hypothetical protein
MEPLQHLNMPEIDATTSGNGIANEYYFLHSISYCQNIDPTDGNCVMKLTPKYLPYIDDKYSKYFCVVFQCDE